MQKALFLIVAVTAVTTGACAPGGGVTAAGATRAAPHGAWVLTELDGAAAPPGVNLQIRKDTLGGSSGCNQYNAGYTIDGDRIELGPVASTRRACQEPAATNEYRFLTTLDEIEGLRWTTDTLELLDTAGKVRMRFYEDEDEDEDPDEDQDRSVHP